MLLQRFTNHHNPYSGLLMRAMLLLCAVLVAGCGATSKSTRNADADNVQVVSGGKPKAEQEVPARARTLYEQAVSVMASGDDLDAQLRFQEFLLQYPNFPGAHINLAIIFARNGDDQGAENSITDALMIDPRHTAALNQLGMLLRRQGKFQEAESAYRKAVAADPTYALAHYNLGVLNELYLQRLDTALLHYERYQALGNNDKQVEKWIADLKRRIGSSQRTANVTE